MRYRKRGTAFAMACLLGILTLAPAADAWAYTPWVKNNGTYVSTDGSAITGVVARGVDVSHWKQSIDWNAVARDDIQFVMLGTRYDGSVDPYFSANAKAAFQAGLKVGAYIYSYATTTDMARQEAEFVLNLIKDYPISYPVVFDVEDSVMSNLSPTQLADIINTFCKTIADAGYYPMLYANDHWLTNKIDMSRVKYDVWAARYDARPAYARASMWQATNAGTVAGINGNVDINFAYKDFSSTIPARTWRFINGKWYFYDNYQLKTGWINDGYNWYYMQDDGTQYKGWLNMGSDYYYLSNDTGQMITGWMQLDSRWYYFNSDGRMAREWVQVDGKWYYLQSDGTMATGWMRNGDIYYFLKSDGSMATGWRNMDGGWYYFDPGNGQLLRGWADIEGYRYYLGADGKMLTGWNTIDGATYFFNADGKLAAGWLNQNNTWYYLGTDGRLCTGWIQLDGAYYYLHTDGRMLTGWLSDGTNQYYMNPSSGKMAVGWKQIDGSWYYFNSTGHMQKGWINIDGKSYYLDESSGKMAANGTYNIGGGSYSFDQNGVCTNQGSSSYGTNFSGNQSMGSGGFINTSGSTNNGYVAVGQPGSTVNGSQSPGSMGSSYNNYNDFYSGPGAGSTGGPAGSSNSGNSGSHSNGIVLGTPPGSSQNGSSGYITGTPANGSPGSSSYGSGPGRGDSEADLREGLTDGPGPGR